MNKIAPNALNDEKDKIRLLRQEYASQREKDEIILARARKRLERCISAEAENRRDGLDDDKFYAGDQWSANDRARRNAERRPCLTINKLPVLIKQVTNDQRQNRPTIDIHPVGDKGDVDSAKIYRGLIREIERESHADIAYDTGFESATRKGWGYWRVLAEYESPDTFDQVLRVKRVPNAFSVYFADNSTEIDGSDATFCFVTEMVDRDEFKLEWPNADPINWSMGGFGDSLSNWVEQYSIRIAEYYEIEQKARELVMLDNGYEGWRDEINPEILASRQIVQSRSSLVPEIWWYKLTAKDILDRTRWLGQCIPVVRCSGDEIFLNGKLKRWGLVRHAKDPQRALNYFKPLSVSTPIPTSTGWRFLGDIHVGDFVFDESGIPVEVVGESPTYLHRECFKIEFDDGTSIIADGEHPWQIDENNGTKWITKVLSTKELVAKKHCIQRAKPLCLPERVLPIHPYLLGVWLGDGTSTEPQICSGDLDLDNMRDNLAELDYSLGQTRVDKTANMFTVLNVRHIFTSLGLLGNKHIPLQYLRASEEQRWALLQGLMDTDGTVNKYTNQCQFTTSSQKISDGMMELLISLGIRTRIIYKHIGKSVFSGGVIRECNDAHQFSFSCPWWQEVFRLKRKKNKHNKPRNTQRSRMLRRHEIVAVEKTHSVPVKCIKVNSASHLFLVGKSMVPTHNTSETERVALAPKAPYIIAEGQLEGYEDVWKEAHTKSMPFLPYRATEIHGHMVPPPQRTPPVDIPRGDVQISTSAAQDMLATTGVRFDATLNERTYDESGRALRELRRSGDVGSFNYIDNLIHSLRRTGEILVDAIPKYYVRPGRVVTIIREDDTEEQIRLAPGSAQSISDVVDQATQKVTRAFDPTVGKYGVTVTIGPSYATRRIETAESMMDFLRAIPQAAPLIADLVAKNQDWEGSEEIATRLAKTLPPGLNQPEMRDVPPQIQAVLSQMQQQIQQLTQERQILAAQVNDREKDRALARERIDKQFASQLLGIVQKAQAAAQKIGADDRRVEAENLRTLASETADLYANLAKLDHEPQGESKQTSIAGA